MRKKFLNVFLLGALTLATTSTFVSCKDYDDDITTLQGLVDANSAALTSTKQALETEIAGLKTQLEAKDAELATLIQNLQKVTEATDAEIAQMKADMKAQISGLESKIAQLNTELSDVEAALKAEDAKLAAKDAELEAKTKELQAANEALAAEVKALQTATAENKAAIEKNIEDIKANKAAIEANVEAIKAAKADIAANKAAIEANKAAIEANKAQAAQNKADIEANAKLIGMNKEAIEKEAVRAAAAESALESKIADANKAIEAINAALAGKLDTSVFDAKMVEIQKQIEALQAEDAKKVNKTDFDAAVAQINALVNAVDTKVAKNLESIESLKDGLKAEETARLAVAADLAQQKTALANLENKVKALELSAATKEELKAEVAKLNEKIDGVQAQVTDNKKDIVALQKAVKDLAEDLDAKYKELVALNVMVESELRSMVFVPAEYYYGIEATSVNYINYYWYTLPGTAYNNKEIPAQTGRYDHKTASKVNQFVATYHLNPSNADLSNLKKEDVKILAGKRLHTKADATDLIKVTDVKVANGDLTVDLDVAQSVVDGIAANEVLVFAAEVSYKNTKGETATITSDYATLVKKATVEEKGIVLAHVDDPVANKQWNGVANPNSTCAIAKRSDIMQTIKAAETAAPQDTVRYDRTLNLNSLVKTHILTSPESEMTAAEFAANYEYKFDLTGLWLGSNNTSESAHATLSTDAEGNTILTPCAANLKGEPDPNALTKRPAIGRTPLVRVQLIEKSSGRVLDYGYIRILIVDEKPVIVTPPGTLPGLPVEITDSKTFTYNKKYTVTNCNGDYTSQITDNNSGHSVYKDWAWTENKLYSLINVSREQFEKIYTIPGDAQVEPETDGQIVQYEAKVKDGEIVITGKATQNIGDFFSKNELIDENGTTTHIVGWSITKAQANAAFADKGNGTVYRAMRYVSIDPYTYPDLYVVFHVSYNNTADATPDTNFSASGTIDWSKNKIAEYWYKSNTSEAGNDEIHANVLAYEDQKSTVADELKVQLSDVFVGNKMNLYNWINVTVGSNAFSQKYGAKDVLSYRLAFVGPSKTYKGVDGKNYTVKPSADGQSLEANGVAIAKLVGGADYKSASEFKNTDFNAVTVEYQNVPAADALLNMYAHNDLNDNAIKAQIGIQAKNECGKVVTVAGSFDVRFLRPINMVSSDVEIEDASVEGLQQIKIQDLVKFTDWRDAWNGKHEYGVGGDYETYYNIQSYEVEGLSNGDKLSKNPNVKTSLNGGAEKSLASVTSNLDFTYNNGVLTYANLGANVQEFTLTFPVKVTYEWGYLVNNVKITVKRTHNNVKGQR